MKNSEILPELLKCGTKTRSKQMAVGKNGTDDLLEAGLPQTSIYKKHSIREAQ